MSCKTCQRINLEYCDATLQFQDLPPDAFFDVKAELPDGNIIKFESVGSDALGTASIDLTGKIKLDTIYTVTVCDVNGETVEFTYNAQRETCLFVEFVRSEVC